MQFWAPDDGRKNCLKHVQRLTEINRLWNVAFCWLCSANPSIHCSRIPERMLPFWKVPRLHPFGLLVAVLVWQTPDAVCAVLSSCWWTEKPSETCRASYRNKLWNIACCWLYAANILATHGHTNVKVIKKYVYLRTEEAFVSSATESLLWVSEEIEAELEHDVHIRRNVQDVLSVADWTVQLRNAHTPLSFKTCGVLGIQNLNKYFSHL